MTALSFAASHFQDEYRFIANCTPGNQLQFSLHQNATDSINGNVSRTSSANLQPVRPGLTELNNETIILVSAKYLMDIVATATLNTQHKLQVYTADLSGIMLIADWFNDRKGFPRLS